MILGAAKLKRFLVANDSKDVMEQFVHDGNQSDLFLPGKNFGLVIGPQNRINGLAFSSSSNGSHGNSKQDPAAQFGSPFGHLGPVTLEISGLIDCRVYAKESRKRFG